MDRFFALVFDPSDRQQESIVGSIAARLSRTSACWTNLIDASGLLIMRNGEDGIPNRSYLLAEESGAVLGTLFSGESDGSYALLRRALTDRESRNIVESGGRYLIKHHWGRYVAFTRDLTTGRVCVLRDPTGTMSCYQIVHCGVHVFFSHVEDCVQVRTLSLSLNWQTVQAMAAGVIVQSGQTMLNEVSEVRAGECIEFHRNAARSSFLWNPVDIARRDVVEDRRIAVDTLRQTVRACVNAWAECHTRIIHSLSGGLDSSIVLSCLMQAPVKPSITCMNYYTLATEGDERRFAKLAAQRSRSELVEHLADGTATKLDGALCGSRSMTPAFYVSEFLHGKFERELADMTQATAFFQGGGGDGVFLQNGAELAPTDYVRRNGMGPRLLQISHDAAQITQLSLWKLVASGIWAALRKRRLALPIDAPLSSTFIAPSVLERISSERKALSHPLLRDVESVPEGKLWHILLTSAPPEFTRPYKQFDRPGIVFPLISQPIHELCLRIPTYLMFDGGRDRALARKAFKNDVPSEIIRRRGKGGADRVIQEIIRANIRFVRDILLDGALAKQGIVGRADLETSLKNVQTMEPAACDEAMLLFEIEVFLQIWRGVERRAAA